MTNELFATVGIIVTGTGVAMWIINALGNWIQAKSDKRVNEALKRHVNQVSR